MAENQGNRPFTSYLGTGWSFPPKFVLETGEVAMTSDIADIEASLKILFGTSLGERFLNPRYGLKMQELLFEPMSTTIKTLVKDRIRIAILLYEPRINLLSLELDTPEQNEGQINLMLEYEVRATNSRFNLVYPFHPMFGPSV
jgi:uncharacterized protein